MMEPNGKRARRTTRGEQDWRGKHGRRHLRAALLGGAVAVGAALPLALPGAAKASDITISRSQGGAARTVNLGLNKSIVIDLPAEAHDLLVSSPEVADAVVRSARRIYVFGKKIGRTNLFVFGRGGEQIAAIDLAVERDIGALTQTIRRLVPGSDVQAEMINDNVVLTGTVVTPQAAAKAVQLAEVFVHDPAGARGFFSSGAGGAPQVSLVDAFRPRRSRVVNLLKITGEDQVHLRVTVAEVQRSVVKQLGIDTAASRAVDDGFALGLENAGQTFLQPTRPMNGIAASVSKGAYDLMANLRALEQTGVMRTLAEPSMTAVSGELAQFKVGGSLPLLKQADCETDDKGSTKRAYQFEDREYGIAMAFTPVVLTSGRISLKVRTEVSEPTAQNMQTGMCGNLVGIRKRLADTTVELPSGGAMVIGGLVQDDVRQVVSGFPGLGKLPIFGALFRSKEFVRNETELVVILTPYLVRPTAPKALTRPDRNFAPASDAAGLLMGRINRVYGTKKGHLPEGRYVGSFGFIIE